MFKISTQKSFKAAITAIILFFIFIIVIVTVFVGKAGADDSDCSNGATDSSMSAKGSNKRLLRDTQARNALWF